MPIEPDRPMRVGVLGPGGVGGLLAAVFARQGDPVVCIASESTCEQLRVAGLSVHSERMGDFSVRVDATPILEMPVDVCLVTVKATQLEGALDRLPIGALGDACSLFHFLTVSNTLTYSGIGMGPPSLPRPLELSPHGLRRERSKARAHLLPSKSAFPVVPKQSTFSRYEHSERTLLQRGLTSSFEKTSNP